MFWQLVKRFNMFEMEVEKKERKKERKSLLQRKNNNSNHKNIF